MAVKLHNFCIDRRDPFSSMLHAIEEPEDDPVHTTGGITLPRDLRGRNPAKERRHRMMLALKEAGMRRRHRAN